MELQEGIGDIQGKARTLHELAGIYSNYGELSKGIALYHESLELFDTIGDVLNKAITLAMLGQVLASEPKNLTTALSYLEQSLEMFQRLQSPYAETVKRAISKIQQMTGNDIEVLNFEL